MPPSTNQPSESAIKLCVDLDGTLIKTDLLWEHLARLLRRNPLAVFPVLFWWAHGRARLKQELARRVTIDPATLPYHTEFLAWLRTQKAAGRKLVLATASDIAMARPVAAYVGLFDEVLGSDGKINLRSGNKVRLLTEKYGQKGFDYAGNSTADYPVWRGARQAVVVNASRKVLQEAAQCTTLGPTFCENFSALTVARRFWGELLVRSGYLAAAGAGSILALAFPLPGIAGFAWVAPGLMLLAARHQTGGDTARIGYVAGLFWALGSFSWLLHIPVTGFPILGWLALSAYLALYPAAWVWLVAYDESQPAASGTWHRRTLWALTGSAVWVALEMLRARLFGGLPWNLLGTSQYAMTPLVQIARVTGVYGLSFIVVWTSLSLFSAGRLILNRPATRFAWQLEIVLPLLAVALLFAVGLARLLPEKTSGQPSKITTKLPYLRVTMVQPSIPQTMIWNGTNDGTLLAKILTLSRQGLTNDTDLLIWPEASLTRMVRYDENTYNQVTDLARTNHVWLILGSDDAALHPGSTNADDADYFNSSFLVSPAGQLKNVYHKRKLVAFGEFIPLVRWVPFIKWFTPITGGFATGDHAVPFELPNLQVHTATLICFEDIFPDFVREYATEDGDFLVNITNDGWFGEGSAQWQQAAAATFRAVENGMPLLRCANNGLTCWIDAHGHLKEYFKDAHGTIYGPGTLTVEIPLLTPGEKRVPTYYHLYGDRFGWGCVAIAVLVITRRWQAHQARTRLGC